VKPVSFKLTLYPSSRSISDAQLTVCTHASVLPGYCEL
jgi:hypothetical protein